MRFFSYLGVSLIVLLRILLLWLTFEVDPRVFGHKGWSVTLQVGLRRFDGLMSKGMANDVDTLLVAEHSHGKGMP